MKFSEALAQAAKKVGWSPAKIAGEVGVTESAVIRWLNGQREPQLKQFQALRARVPGFAELVDRGMVDRGAA